MKKLFVPAFSVILLLLCLAFTSCETWLRAYFILGNGSDDEVTVQMRFQWQTLEDMLPTGEQSEGQTTVYDTTIVIPPHSAYKEKYDLGVHGWKAKVEADINFARYGIIPIWESIVAIIVKGDTIPCDRIRNRNEWGFDSDQAEFSYDLGRDIYEYYNK